MDKSETTAAIPPDSAAAAPESQPVALDDAQLDGVTGGAAVLNLPKLPGSGGEPESYLPEYAHGP